MRIKKWLLRLLGFELLAPEALKLLLQVWRIFQTDLQNKLAVAARRTVWLLVLLSLLSWALFFGLLGLALYLNAWLGSAYQGFWLVGAGCLLCLLLALLFGRRRSR